MRLNARNLLPISLLVLSGCATTIQDCDLRQDDVDFFTKLGCDVGGTNRAIIDRQEQQLLTAQQQRDMFQMVYDDLAAIQAATRKSLEERRRAQASLNASANALLKRLKQKYANRSDIQKKLDGMGSEFDVLKNSADSQDSATIRKLEMQYTHKTRQLEALEKQLDALL